MHEIACQHCKAARERIETLEEEVRQLRDHLAGTTADPDYVLFARLGVSRSEELVLRMLLNRDLLTTDAYMAARQADNEDLNPKVLDVFVCKIRKKLTPLGIEIQTLWGRGWFMTAQMKAKVRSFGDVPPADLDSFAGSDASRQYRDIQATVTQVLKVAPYGLTWTALRRATNVTDARLIAVIQIMLNNRLIRRDFTPTGKQFAYSVVQAAVA